jgi:hypothetical protein
MRVVRFAALIVASGALACKPPTVDDIYAVLPPIGSQVPAFRYPMLDGTTVTPESLKGSPAVIALWSTTCSASLLALKSIAALQANYAPSGVHVVILANDRDSAVVASLFARNGIQTPAALAAGGLADTFTHGQSLLPWRKTFPLPTFLLLDGTGHVVYRQFGIERDSASRLVSLRARLDSLVANPIERRLGAL